MLSRKYDFRDFVDFEFIKRTIVLAAVLFIFFLVGRFGGITYYPEWRVLNLLILGGAILIPRYIRTNIALDTHYSPLSILVLALSSYTIFTVFFLLYLETDWWFREFIINYSSELFNGDQRELGFVMLFEGLEFSVIIALFAWALKFAAADKRNYTQ